MTVALCWPELGIQCYKTFISEDNYLVERLWVNPSYTGVSGTAFSH